MGSYAGLQRPLATRLRLLAIGPRLAPNENMKVLKAPLVFADPILADADHFNNAHEIRNSIVFINRGKCTFLEKLTRAHAAGALAVVIGNTDESDPNAAFVMSIEHREAIDSITSVMVSFNVATQLMNEKPATLSVICCAEETANVLFDAPKNNHSYQLTDLPPFENKSTERIAVLWKACRSGDSEVVTELIGMSGIATADSWGCTALHHAVIGGNVDIVRILLDEPESGEMCLATDLSGQTPLHYAALTGNFLCAEAILENRSDLLVLKNEGGLTPMHVACLEGKHNVLSAIFVTDQNVLTLQDLDGMTPLHYACKGGFVECAELVISGIQGNFSLLDNNGLSPVDYICQYINNSRGNNAASAVNIFQALLESGAKVERRSEHTSALPFDIVINKGIRGELEMRYLKEMMKRQEEDLAKLTREKDDLEKVIDQCVSRQRRNEQLLDVVKEKTLDQLFRHMAFIFSKFKCK